MANITLYHFEGCPACGHAKQWIKELQQEKPELQKARIDMVDVHKTSNFTPRPLSVCAHLFVDGRKVLEGAVTRTRWSRSSEAPSIPFNACLADKRERRCRPPHTCCLPLSPTASFSPGISPAEKGKDYEFFTKYGPGCMLRMGSGP